jgi:Acetoacetate decarboxylase (ADC)
LKATFDIDPKLLDNAGEFTNSFFSRFKLRHAPKPLCLSEKISKNYLFPTLYGDVTCAMAVFMCSYKKAEKLMLHPAIKPVKMPLGRALVAFSCYEYKKVLGVAPYNEIAMTIPILVDPGINVPVLPMIAPIFKNFGYYVFSMPVTSQENNIRGHKIWGLPKVVQEIDIYEDGDQCVTKANAKNGETYFQLRVPMTGKPTNFDVSSNLYSRLGDDLLQSETNFKAVFNVVKHPQLLLKKNAVADRTYLKIGDSHDGDMLRELEIEPRPFQTRFAKNMSSCFDLPNPTFQSPIEFK